MDPIDQLPPDHRAVLSLLLRQGRSYADIANLLGIPQSTVRDRAHAALDAIAGDATTESPPAAPAPPATAAPVAPAASRPPSVASSVASPPPPHRPAPSSRSASRRAGALLLAAIVAVVVVTVILVASLGGGGGSSHTTSAAGSTTSTSGSKTAAGSGEPHVDKQLNLTSPDSSSNAVGVVEIVSEKSKRAFLVNAEHLSPTSGSFFYAAWLYNSPSDARVLGRAPAVTSNGRLQAVGALPSNASHFHKMLITRETSTKPSQPGPIVLSGPFSLH